MQVISAFITVSDGLTLGDVADFHAENVMKCVSLACSFTKLLFNCITNIKLCSNGAAMERKSYQDHVLYLKYYCMNTRYNSFPHFSQFIGQVYSIYTENKNLVYQCVG